MWCIIKMAYCYYQYLLCCVIQQTILAIDTGNKEICADCVDSKGEGVKCSTCCFEFCSTECRSLKCSDSEDGSRMEERFSKDGYMRGSDGKEE